MVARKPAVDIALAGVGGLAAASGWVIQRRRYLRRIAADPDYSALSAMPIGRSIDVRAFDGTALHAEVFGPEGAPTMVLAHGWTEALRFWIHQIVDLSREDFRVVAYDLRGHGSSSKSPSGDYSIGAFGDDLEVVLRSCLPAGERAVLVGHSLGAMSIAAWAERHPVSERASAAGLLCTGVVDVLTEHLLFGPPRIPPAMFRLISAYVLAAPGPIPAFSPSALDLVIRYAGFGPTAGPAQVAFYERMLRECPPDVRAGTAATMADMDLLDALSRLTVPTLVLCSSRDRLTPPTHAHRIAAALPEPADVVELPLTGHMAPLERPAEVNYWLRKLAARARATAAPTPATNTGALDAA
ncbi:MAG TPA: alpha/beta fold hydrolase [Solirubrobacteraceae bacterium]